MSSKQSVELSAKDFPIDKVTIYNGTAQVERTIKTTLEAKGFYYVCLHGVPSSLESDSIRVEGKGKAKLMEVSCSSKSVPIATDANLDDSETKAKLVNEQKKLDGFLVRQTQLHQSIEAEQSIVKLLNNYAANITQLTEKKAETLLGNSAVDGLDRFLKVYKTNLLEHQGEKSKLERELAELNKEISVCHANISRWQTNTSEYEDVNEIKILVDNEEEKQEVEFRLLYAVSPASWVPFYDVRVFSEEKKIELVYKADLFQVTGEDWNDAKIVLSTAKPSTSGNEVTFKRDWNVSFYEPPRPLLRKKAGGSSKSTISAMAFAAPPPAPAMLRASFDDEEGMAEAEESYMAMSTSAPNMNVQSAVAKSGIHASSFEIPVKYSIPSDNNPHRVTVAVLSFSPEFSFSSYPKLSEKVFLKAKSVNDSVYPILAGECSIFLDGTFVAKTSIQDVSPNEKFDFSLGVDDSVKIQYKPLIKNNSSGGILTKSNIVAFNQVIVVNNTKSIDVSLKLVDQIPRSTTDKIKVSIIEPKISNDDKSVSLGEYNCVEWQATLKPSEERKFTLKYEVSYPAEERIQGC